MSMESCPVCGRGFAVGERVVSTVKSAGGKMKAFAVEGSEHLGCFDMPAQLPAEPVVKDSDAPR